MAKDLVIQPQCLLCQAILGHDENASTPCNGCLEKLNFPPEGLSGMMPMRWIALNWYEDQFRQLLLNLRRNRQRSAIHYIAKLLAPRLPSEALLVPIPSWKKASQANPLPHMLARELDRPWHQLLARQRATLGQHHLNYKLRQDNQKDAFKASPELKQTMIDWSLHQAWIVDDILTTGATVQAARNCLQRLGIPVGGTVCMAKTPLDRQRHKPMPMTP
ncbi:MAG: Uncharacterised protein [Prochlorococcus marinus str. MIT 9215]|nr:MAG: Uncharacterised protein [Prochlorococcus marinus str. MIT 9215]